MQCGWTSTAMSGDRPARPGERREYSSLSPSWVCLAGIALLAATRLFTQGSLAFVKLAQIVETL